MGIVAFGMSTSPYCIAVSRRFFSTIAAITMESIDKKIPVPILWSTVIPDGFLVIALATGTKIRSYIGIKTTTERLMKDCNEAAGTSKFEPRDLSKVAPCLVNKVDDCENTIAYTKHVIHIGINLRIALASSTSLILQIFPFSLEPSGASNALLRNLCSIKIYTNKMRCLLMQSRKKLLFLYRNISFKWLILSYNKLECLHI